MPTIYTPTNIVQYGTAAFIRDVDGKLHVLGSYSINRDGKVTTTTKAVFGRVRVEVMTNR